jgi:penicillin-binding protein 2
MVEYQLRARIYAGLVVAVLLILTGRLVQLQLVSNEAYWGASQSNAVRERRVLPARGAIYDRAGTLLVDNEPSYTILLTPRYFDEAKVPLLADLLQVPDSVVAARVDEARAWSAFRPSRSFREVPFETFSRVQEQLYRLPGVSYEVEQTRRYHTDARATHALGYLREIDPRTLEATRAEGYRQGDAIGKTGLEKAYEDRLRGEQGSEFKLVDIRGMEVEAYHDGAEDRLPRSGYDLHLALDHRVQALAESLFVNKRGGAVALDPNTGAILAMVSHPDFDPGVFSRAVGPTAWDSLRLHPDKPLFNRATMSGWPPGSTWKPFMSLVALEEGVIGPDDTLPCPAGWRLGRRVFTNHGGKGYGNITIRKALEVSCNTFYWEVMSRLDLATWERWARRFGFGSRAPLDVGDQQPGLIPDSSYYDRMYGTWTSGYTINLAIGQGDMSVTPLQLARYTAAVANGGALPPPHLVEMLVHPETGDTLRPALPAPETLPVKDEHFDVVRQGMKQVMEKGTGRWVQIPGVPSGGKTGTSQNPHGEDHSLFIMFAPFDDPQIALAVAVENAGYGGRAAAPIASFMAEMYLTGRLDMEDWTRRWQMKRLMTETRSADEGEYLDH